MEKTKDAFMEESTAMEKRADDGSATVERMVEEQIDSMVHNMVMEMVDGAVLSMVRADSDEEDDGSTNDNSQLYCSTIRYGKNLTNSSKTVGNYDNILRMHSSKNVDENVDILRTQSSQDNNELFLQGSKNAESIDNISPHSSKYISSSNDKLRMHSSNFVDIGMGDTSYNLLKKNGGKMLPKKSRKILCSKVVTRSHTRGNMGSILPKPRKSHPMTRRSTPKPVIEIMSNDKKADLPSENSSEDDLDEVVNVNIETAGKSRSENVTASELGSISCTESTVDGSVESHTINPTHSGTGVTVGSTGDLGESPHLRAFETRDSSSQRAVQTPSFSENPDSDVSHIDFLTSMVNNLKRSAAEQDEALRKERCRNDTLHGECISYKRDCENSREVERTARRETDAEKDVVSRLRTEMRELSEEMFNKRQRIDMMCDQHTSERRVYTAQSMELDDLRAQMAAKKAESDWMAQELAKRYDQDELVRPVVEQMRNLVSPSHAVNPVHAYDRTELNPQMTSVPHTSESETSTSNTSTSAPSGKVVALEKCQQWPAAPPAITRSISTNTYFRDESRNSQNAYQLSPTLGPTLPLSVPGVVPMGIRSVSVSSQLRSVAPACAHAQSPPITPDFSKHEASVLTPHSENRDRNMPATQRIQTSEMMPDRDDLHSQHERMTGGPGPHRSGRVLSPFRHTYRFQACEDGVRLVPTTGQVQRNIIEETRILGSVVEPPPYEDTRRQHNVTGTAEPALTPRHQGDGDRRRDRDEPPPWRGSQYGTPYASPAAPRPNEGPPRLTSPDRLSITSTEVIENAVRDYRSTTDKYELKQFHDQKWPQLDINTSWTDYRRLWVIPALEDRIPLKMIASRLYSVLPGEKVQYISQTVPDRNDVVNMVRCLDDIHNTSGAERTMRRTAETELDDARRISDELVASFGQRILYLVAKAYPMTPANRTNELACKIFLRGLKCSITGPMLQDFRDLRGSRDNTSFTQLLDRAVNLELNYNLAVGRQVYERSSVTGRHRAVTWKDTSSFKLPVQSIPRVPVAAALTVPLSPVPAPTVVTTTEASQPRQRKPRLQNNAMRPDNFFPKKATCFYCEVKGHCYKDCFTRARDEREDTLKKGKENYIAARDIFFATRRPPSAPDDGNQGNRPSGQQERSYTPPPQSNMLRKEADSLGRCGPAKKYNELERTLRVHTCESIPSQPEQVCIPTAQLAVTESVDSDDATQDLGLGMMFMQTQSETVEPGDVNQDLIVTQPMTDITMEEDADIAHNLEEIELAAYNMQMHRELRTPQMADGSPHHLETRTDGSSPPGDSRPWLAPMMFEGQLLLFMLDTGSNVSIINDKTFHSRYPDRQLESWYGNINHAGGHGLNITGCMEGNIEMTKSTMAFDFAVARVGWSDAILGMDFINRPEVSLDVENGHIDIQNASETYRIVLIRPPADGAYLGYLQEATVMPPRCHNILHLTVVQNGLALTEDHQVMTAPAFDIGGGIQIPTSLATLGKDRWKNAIPVTNFSEEEITLPAGLMIIVGEEVDDEVSSTHTDIFWPANEVTEDDTTELYVRAMNCPDTPKKREVPEHLQDLYQRSIRNVTRSEDEKLIKNLIIDYESVFSKKGEPLPCTTAIQHRINTGDHAPIRQKMRRLGPVRDEITEAELTKLRENGVVVPSNSPWRSPVVLVKKKNGEVRFCIDFRLLNDCTEKDSYPLPRIDSTLEALAGSRWFCTMDLTSGFWQIPLHKDDRHKTAFATKSGLFEFTVMPFGLCNAPATFERCMENVLRGLCWTDCLVYIDDIITAGTDVEQTVRKTALVFERLLQANLRLRADKCHLFQPDIKFLGHVVSQVGIQPDPDKASAMFNRPRPQNKDDVKSFLGSTGYYRTHIANYSATVEPLAMLLRQNTEWVWEEDQQNAYESLRKALTTAPILGYPTSSHEGWLLDTDASDYAIGSVLSQVQEGREVVIANASMTLSATQRRYCVTKKELLALQWSLQHFKPYLYGRQFHVRTDHKSLLAWRRIGLRGNMEIERWINQIDQYDFTLAHRPGRDHGNADWMSRPPQLPKEEGKHDISYYPCKMKPCICAELIETKMIPDPFEGEPEFLNHPMTDASMVMTCNEIHVENAEDDAVAPQEVETGEDDTLSQPFTPETEQAVTLDELILDELISPDTTIAGDAQDDVPEALAWSGPRLHMPQSNYEPIAFIMQRLRSGEGKPSQSMLRKFDRQARKFFNYWTEYRLIDECLYRVKYGKHLAVLPPFLRQQLFRHLHANPMGGGHFGVDKTMAKFNDRTWWPGMKGDVANWIRQCDACQVVKTGPGQGRLPLLQTIVGDCNDKVAIDLIGPLPEDDGYKYILTVQDYYSKWCEAYPLTRKKPENVVLALRNNWVARFGPPKVLLSDNGMEFAGKIFNDLMAQLGVVIEHSSPYYPRSNGMVERLNGTIQDLIKAMAKESRKGWVELLPMVTSTYRAAVHETTGFSPNMMMFGREIRLPIDIMMDNRDTVGVCPTAYTTWLQTSLSAIKTAAIKNIQKSQATQKLNHDKKQKPRTVMVGDLVLRWRPVRRKLESKWIGPYTVREVTGRTVFIENDRGIKRADVSQLKIYNRSELTEDQIFLQENIDSDSDSEDEILSHDIFHSPDYDSDDAMYPCKIRLDDKPPMVPVRQEVRILPVNYQSPPSSGSEEDSSDKENELERSVDGQIGRGINHDERRVIAESVTRYGRISRSPTRFQAGATMLREPALETNTNGTIRPEPILSDFRPTVTTAVQNDVCNTTDIKSAGLQIEREHCNRSPILSKAPEVHNTPPPTTLKRADRQDEVSKPPKRTRFYCGRVGMLRAVPRNVISISRGKDTSRTRDDSIVRQGNTAGSYVRVKSNEGLQKVQHLGCFWTWLTNSLKKRHELSIAIADELSWLRKNQRHDCCAWTCVAIAIEDFLKTVTPRVGTKHRCDSAETLTPVSSRPTYENIIQLLSDLSRIKTVVKDKGHIRLKDFVTGDGNGCDSALIDDLHAAEKRDDLDSCSNAVDGKSVKTKGEIVLNFSPLCAFSNKIAYSSPVQGQIGLSPPVKGKIGMSRSPKATDMSPEEADCTSNALLAHATRVCHDGKSTRFDPVFHVIDSCGVTDTMKRPWSGCSDDEAPLVNHPVIQEHYASLNRTPVEAIHWADILTDYREGLYHPIRVGITRAKDGQVTYFNDCERDTLPRYTLYTQPIMPKSRPCPFGCIVPKDGPVGMLQHLRMRHQPIRLEWQCPEPYCKVFVKAECHELLPDKHAHQIDLDQWQVEAFQINTLYGGEQYTLHPNFLLNWNIDLELPTHEYKTKHWLALAFLYEQTWLSQYQQHTMNYQEILVPQAVKRHCQRGPLFGMGTNRPPYPEKVNPRLRDGEIQDRFVNIVRSTGYRRIGYMDGDDSQDTQWNPDWRADVRVHYVVTKADTPVAGRTRHKRPKTDTRPEIPLSFKSVDSSDDDDSEMLIERKRAAKSKSKSRSRSPEKSRPSRPKKGHETKRSTRRDPPRKTIKKVIVKSKAIMDKLLADSDKGFKKSTHALQQEPVNTVSVTTADVHGNEQPDLFEPSTSVDQRLYQYLKKPDSPPVSRPIRTEFVPLPLPVGPDPHEVHFDVGIDTVAPNAVDPPGPLQLTKSDDVHYPALTKSLQQTVRHRHFAEQVGQEVRGVDMSINAIVCEELKQICASAAIQQRENTNMRSSRLRHGDKINNVPWDVHTDLKTKFDHLVQINADLSETHRRDIVEIRENYTSIAKIVCCTVRLLQAHTSRSAIEQSLTLLLEDACKALDDAPATVFIPSRRLRQWMDIRKTGRIDPTKAGLLSHNELVKMYNDLYTAVIDDNSATNFQRNLLTNIQGPTSRGHPPVANPEGMNIETADIYCRENIGLHHDWKDATAVVVHNVVQQDAGLATYNANGQSTDIFH